MIQKDLQEMIQEVLNNKKKFRTLYKEGYFTYDKNDSLKGMIAIVNNKAVLSFIQDGDNEKIATADFNNNGIRINKLIGDSCSHYESGWRDPYKPHKIHYDNKKDDIIQEIETIYKHCIETKNKPVLSRFDKIFGKSRVLNEKMSRQEVKALLEETLNHLNKSRNLDERSKLSNKGDNNTELKSEDIVSNLQNSQEDKEIEIS